VSSRTVKERIQDILNAIDSIQAEIGNIDFIEFSHNEMLVKAILYDLIIIGEAASNIPREVKSLSPEVPWRLMSDMRNIIAHEYFQVNLQITWKTIYNELPLIIEPLRQLLAEL
jgi:uncharacterized protein with HEPN domain